MQIKQLQESVYEANIALVKYGLVILTWGNVSGIDREQGLFAIKPSGMSYASMTPGDMVVVDMDGNVVEGHLRPSSDMPTHLALYKAFEGVGSIAHTHSRYATSWAQCSCDVPCLGTTHADAFYGPVPCTRSLSREEIEHEYEKNTGLVIIETFSRRTIDPLAVPAVLVSQHGPFAWGETVSKCVDSAVTLEEVCAMAIHTQMAHVAASVCEAVPQMLMDKHYFRKHGPGAYYGQK